MYYNPSHSSRAATIIYHRKQIAEAMYYNSFQSSRAATILYRRKQVAEAMCNWSGHIDKVLSMFPKFCWPAGASFSERSLGKSVYYYLFQFFARRDDSIPPQADC
jgi:hypothetical protein